MTEKKRSKGAWWIRTFLLYLLLALIGTALVYILQYSITGTRDLVNLQNGHVNGNFEYELIGTGELKLYDCDPFTILIRGNNERTEAPQGTEGTVEICPGEKSLHAIKLQAPSAFTLVRAQNYITAQGHEGQELHKVGRPPTLEDFGWEEISLFVILAGICTVAFLLVTLERYAEYYSKKE